MNCLWIGYEEKTSAEAVAAGFAVMTSVLVQAVDCPEWVTNGLRMWSEVMTSAGNAYSSGGTCARIAEVQVEAMGCNPGQRVVAVCCCA